MLSERWMYFLFLAFFAVVLIGLELAYFRIADKFDIIDKPNHRSSHSVVTIRGGGIIFLLGAICAFFWSNFTYPLFILSLLFIGVISFADDVSPVSKKLRLGVHLVSVGMVFYQLGLFDLPIYIVVTAAVFVIGTINAINFMDGINGITGAYALVTLITLWFTNIYRVEFTEQKYLDVMIVAVVVFSFFNFRKKAKCFAGDVGSVSIAFFITFLLLQLITTTQNFSPLLFLTVYGLDAVSTIFFRLLRGENIGEAHRSHLYQFLANERKIPHVAVSAIYGSAQLLINVVVIAFPMDFSATVLLLLVLAVIFLLIRLHFEGVNKLIKRAV